LIVRVLGSAAGGGVPQWNCACANCRTARAGQGPRRTQSSFAVSGNGERWWLVNVSPDVAVQIEACEALQPREGRGTPIAGMLLTDANVDHVGGLAVLRQAGDHAFTLYSSGTVRRLVAGDRAFAAFNQSPHRWIALGAGETVDLGERLRATVVPVPGMTPGYAGREMLADAVVAYEVEDGNTGARVLFAPVFSAWSQALGAAVERCGLAFADGSFWSDDELAGVGVAKAARALGHLPAAGPFGSFRALRELAPATRIYYAHLNNTNPLLDPGSGPALEIERVGIGVAYDGLEIDF
jgi:pyrroloquinoline quinone biosynthesis protein B